jgi:hypothetical protein
MTLRITDSGLVFTSDSGKAEDLFSRASNEPSKVMGAPGQFGRLEVPTMTGMVLPNGYTAPPATRRYQIFVNGLYAWDSRNILGERACAAASLGAVVEVYDTETGVLGRLMPKR